MMKHLLYFQCLQWNWDHFPTNNRCENTENITWLDNLLSKFQIKHSKSSFVLIHESFSSITHYIKGAVLWTNHVDKLAGGVARKITINDSFLIKVTTKQGGGDLIAQKSVHVFLRQCVKGLMKIDNQPAFIGPFK